MKAPSLWLDRGRAGGIGWEAEKNNCQWNILCYNSAKEKLKDFIRLVFEKRRYKRIAFREAVEFHVLPGAPAHGAPLPSFGGCLSWDLSEGGLRFRAYSFIPLNTDLSVEFSVENDRTVKLVGRVVWIQKLPHSEQYNLGLEFAKTPQNIHGQKVLHRYLMKYLYPQRKPL